MNTLLVYLYSFIRGSFLTLLFLLTSQNLMAQNTYLMSLTNGVKISSNSFEFDVLIKSDGENFELTSYQVALSLDAPVNGNSISFFFIDNSSEISNIPSAGIGLNNSDGNYELTFGSMPGSDIVTSQVKRVGRFRVETSESFGNDPGIDWDFSGNITTILTGHLYINITNPDNHFSDLSPTSVGSDETTINDFQLFQNYPNPFNPTTKISFNLKDGGNVSLTVYNALGEMVTDLVSGYLNSGKHEIVFNAANLASGIYFYRLAAGNEFTDFKKMILMK